MTSDVEEKPGELVWETVKSKGGDNTGRAVCRARIPGGWLVRRTGEDGITFVPFQGKGGW